MKLMFFVLSNSSLLDFLLEDLSLAGIKGATVINSTGMGMILSKKEDSILGLSLKSLFNNTDNDSHTIFCIIENNQLEIVKKVIYDVVGDLNKPNTGVFFTLPIDDIDGINYKNS